MRESIPNAAESKSPFSEMMAIALPSVVTMTSYSVMQFIDSLMVSRIEPADPVWVAAQGNGGILAWMAMAFGLGTFTVINSFVSQHLGAGSPQKGAAYAWNGLYLAAALSVLLVPLGLWGARALFSSPLYGHSGTLLEAEVGYARVVLLGAFFTLASRGLSQYFFGLHKPVIVTIAALSGNVVNLVANAVLIFGEAGPPDGTPLAGVFAGIAQSLGVEAMGVRGAAFGTVLGTSVELLIPLALFLSPAYQKAYRTRDGWRPDLKRLGDILRVGWPAGLMMFSELLCWGYLMSVLLKEGGEAAALARGLSEEAAHAEGVLHTTAGWIALRYMHASFMPTVGLSIAVAAVVGRCIGMGRPDLAYQRAALGLKLAIGYMGLCALVFVVFREPLVGVFIDPSYTPAKAEHLLRVGGLVLIAAAVFQMFDALVIILSGALRGAGDTFWPGVITVVLAWVCIVGGGHLLIELMPRWGSLGPWIGASAYIICLGVSLLLRAKSGAWRRIKLIEGEPETSAGEGSQAPSGEAPGP